jgi:tRNA U38,U39,U40 pseudouridine synthase TruA
MWAWERLKPEDIKAILKSKDRKKAGPTLPPNGLFHGEGLLPHHFSQGEKAGKEGRRMKIGFFLYQLGALGVF